MNWLRYLEGCRQFTKKVSESHSVRIASFNDESSNFTLNVSKYSIRIHSHLNLDENEDSFPILMHTNKKCDWIWPIYIKYVMGGCFAGGIINCAVSVLLSYFLNEHLKYKEFYHIYKFMYVYLFFMKKVVKMYKISHKSPSKCHLKVFQFGFCFWVLVYDALY